MFDPSHFLSGFRIPSDVLIALDWRPYHFAVQPFHFLIRAVHVLSVAGFFGAIAVLDLRLMGVRLSAPLRALADQSHPWLYATFAVAMATGLALFFYDPLHVGSHAYFTVKLLFLVGGLINAGIFHRTGLAAAITAQGRPPRRTRIAGTLSLVCWTVVMAASSLNVEGAPKRILTYGKTYEDLQAEVTPAPPLEPAPAN